MLPIIFTIFGFVVRDVHAIFKTGVLAGVEMELGLKQ